MTQLLRARQIAAHVSGVALDDVVVLTQLGWDPDTEPTFADAVDKAYTALGSVAYKNYREHELGSVFEQRGREMWEAVQLAAGDARKVLIGGHEVLINALGFASAGGNTAIERIMDKTVFGKAEGFTLTFENGVCVEIEMHL